MFRFSAIALATGVVLIATGCASSPAPANSAADVQAVKDTEAAWSRDCGSKDTAKCVSYYSTDATLMAPNQPIIHGRDNAKPVFDGMYKDPNFSLSWKGDAAEVSGDMAYTQGTYAMTASDAKGNKVNDKGKYLTVWKKQADGSWKAAEDIFNSDMPMPGGN